MELKTSLQELIERAFFAHFVEEGTLETYRPEGLGVPFLLSQEGRKVAVQVLPVFDEKEAKALLEASIDTTPLEQAGVGALRRICWHVPSWSLSEQGVERIGGPREPTLSVEELLLREAQCNQCQLRETCSQVVPFEIVSEPVKVLFVGRDPGAEEDAQGRPFVGPAGQILRGLIEKFGFAAEGCAISNVTKCRPENNDYPGDVVASTCASLWITKEVEVLQPEALVAIGGDASKILTGNELGISKARGTWLDAKAIFGRLPVMPTFHTSYYLRASGDQKKEIAKQMSEDLIKVREKVKEVP